MSQLSDIAFMEALNTGLLKSWDARVFKFLEIKGPHTWKEVQTKMESIMGKRITDSNINSATTRLNKAGKLKISGEKINEKTGFKNSIYEVVK